MRNLGLIALLCVPVLAVSPAQAAQKLVTLFAFKGVSGDYPGAGLTADRAGNLYGTTEQGGSGKKGTVFELVRPAKGQAAWTETVLVSFTGSNGEYPQATLIADGAGNLYGSTFGGGAGNAGTVFELTPPAAGQTAWTHTILVSFNAKSASSPIGTLIFDGAGNLYGAAYLGGASNDGAAFELMPPAAGQTAWTETILATFDGTNGTRPGGGLIADKSGNLFGVTTGGGASDNGTVFALTPPAAGQKAWTETVILSFDFTHGREPLGNLIADGAGNFFGTTYLDASGNGTVFELTPPPAGQTDWTQTVLYDFTIPQSSGRPTGTLVADKSGNLYGTSGDGAYGSGSIFKLVRPVTGQTAWTEKDLVSFNDTNGSMPNDSLIADKAGNLYGTTNRGYRGTNRGSVFELPK